MNYQEASNKRRPTRADVAQLAGTSTAVVSYVINNGPRQVAASTRARVLDAVEKLDYRPNSIARALAAGKTGTIGLVVPDSSNSFFARLAHNIENQAYARGLVLFLGNSAEDQERERAIIDSFVSRQVDGLIYIGVGESGELDSALDAAIPVVALDRRIQNERIHSVVIDNQLAARTATDHLVQHGLQQIAIIAGPSSLSTALLRVGGWRDSLLAAGLPHGEDLVVHQDFTQRGGYLAAKKLLTSLENGFDGLFISSEDQAVGALRALAESGRSIPEDVAIVSFDGTQVSEYSVPSLSTIAQPFEEIAQRAITALTGNSVVSGRQMAAAFEFLVRESCGCKKERHGGWQV